jgi:hypothetical protein
MRLSSVRAIVIETTPKSERYQSETEKYLRH